MKKLTLLKSMLLLCALVVGSTSVWAKQYKKITSPSELVDGTKYLIISEEVTSKTYALSKESGNYRAQTEVTVENDMVEISPATNADDTTPFEITLIESDDKWNLYDHVNGKYLGGGAPKSSGNNNYLKTGALVTETGKTTYNGVWDISIAASGIATITNQNSFYIQYNSGQSWFGSYTAAQKKVYLYKEIAEPIAPAGSFTWDFSSTGIGTVTASQTNILTATDGFTTFKYVAGSSDKITDGYLKPNGGSAKSGGKPTNRYVILHIENSGTLTFTSNSASGKQGNYEVYQAGEEDITKSTLRTTITTSSENLTKSGDIDIANGEFVFIGFGSQIYTEEIVWTVPNKLFITTTANMDGWRTFYESTTQNYEVDANTTIYTVASKTGESNKVELTAAAGKIIPGQTPVILKTTAGDRKMVLTKTETDADLGYNLLAAATGSSAIDGYRLGFGSIGVGFYKYAGTPAAGTVYIASGNVTTSARELGIGFGDDVTAINKVEAKKVENGVFYNLAGQQVAQPTKGLYIVNGKKVVLK